MRVVGVGSREFLRSRTSGSGRSAGRSTLASSIGVPTTTPQMLIPYLPFYFTVAAAAFFFFPPQLAHESVIHGKKRMWGETVLFLLLKLPGPFCKMYFYFLF